MNNSVIRNVTIENGLYRSDGIFLMRSDNNRIENSDIQNSQRGVSIRRSINTTITNNHMKANLHGVYIEFGNKTNLINNTINASFGDGIDIWNSEECNIFNNTFDLNSWGVYIEVAANNYVMDNKIQNGIFGLVLDAGTKNTIARNDISYNNFTGILMYSGTNFNDISDNKLNHNTHGIMSIVNFDQYN